MALDRRAAQQQIDLIIVVPEPLQILDAPQRRLPIRHRRIQIMLLPMLIHAEALERQVPPGPELRLHRPRHEHRALHPQVPHPVLHHRQLHRDHTRNLDRAAEGNLPVPLREMQVAHAELRALDVDRQVHLTAPGEVLDIAIPAVFRPAGDRSRALLADFLKEVRGGRGAGVDVFGLGGLGDDAVEGVCGDELAFALVPESEDVGGRGTAEDAGVDEAGEADVGDVPGGAEDAFEVPDGFCAIGMGRQGSVQYGWGVWYVGKEVEWRRGRGRGDQRLRIYLIQKPATVLLIKHTREPPRLLFERLHILDLNEEYVTRLGRFDLKRAGEVMHPGEIDGLHVVGAVVVADLAARPVQAFDLDDLAVLDGAGKGD